MQKRFAKKPLKKIIIDEIYTYIGKKTKRYYIFTAVGYDDLDSRYPFYYLTQSINYNDLYNFESTLPAAQSYYSDGALIYNMFFGSKITAQKSVQTNLVESLNSQVRQYVSSVKRKTKCYAKLFSELDKKLAMVIINKIMT